MPARTGDDEDDVPAQSGRARALAVGLVLLLDAAMVGGGVVMIRNHFARAEAAPVALGVAPDAAPAAAPTSPAATAPATPPKKPPPAAKPVPLPPIVPATTTPPVATVPTPPRPATPPRPPVTKPPRDEGPALPPILRPPVDAGVPAVPDAPPPEPPPLPEPPDAASPLPEAPDATPALEPGVKDPWVESMTRGIREVVESHRDVIEDCYRRAAKSATSAEPIEGRVEVHLTILPSGDAEDVRVVENRTGSEPLGRCLVAVMRTWHYPAPGQESMEFVWPFTFRGETRDQEGQPPPGGDRDGTDE